ncbi:hypothetical protein [Paenibacillus oleatilyticus]|uniref:hypothetical protein n=1 Tax=Paenibacillus oleatilyticus TaxID=2594886 RepID=UPI001C1F390A|nr:hypothetical protein [Paenibacillus oleatilyticus]MBU7320291.1 hypothetical protein [Paenibacillus oleatilyticus]
MKKMVINGLLALSLTAGIVASPIGDSTVQAQTTNGVQSTQAQVQPSGYYRSIWFEHDDLRYNDGWFTARDKLTVTSNTNYTLQVKQYTYFNDNSSIDNVEYWVLNETPGGSGNYGFRLKGNGKHVRNFTLPPGNYKVEYRSNHKTPVEIRGDLFPS